MTTIQKVLGVFVIAILALIPFNSYSQGLTSEQIDSLVEKSFELIPEQAGIAIAVVKDGKVVHSKGYGVTSIETKEKVDENTLFAIASNSKSFTTAALAILVDEGKLSWQDKVVDYIPEFRMYNPYVTTNFNIQDLLTHRSGLGLGAGDLMGFPDGSDFVIDDILKSFQYQKPVSAFRTKFDYDNLLYQVAGEVIARISGVSWEEFVETRIMQPLGMNRSVGLFQRLGSMKNVAQPHSSLSGEFLQVETFTETINGAAGGIYSSVNDLSKWVLMHLNGGKYGDNLEQELFSQVAQNEMWKQHTPIMFTVKPDPRTKTHFWSYGLGWFLADFKGYINVMHSGGLPGMLSIVRMVPELNLGVIVLTNSWPGGNSDYTLTQSIVESYLEIEKKDWITEASLQIEAQGSEIDSVVNKVWETVATTNSESLKFDDYIGTYEDNWFGKVKVFFKEDKLWFESLRSPKLNGEMFYYKGTTFAIKMEYTALPCDAFAIFNLNEEGKAIGIKMKGISPGIDFSFDYQDLDLKRVE